MRRGALSSLAVIAIVAAVGIGLQARAATQTTNTVEQCWKPGMGHEASIACEFTAATGVEKQLDEAYNKLYGDAKSAAVDNPATISHKGLTDALHKSEAAFKTFVAAQCGYETQLYTGTPGAADADALCRIRLISQQLKTLEPSKQPHN
ncbi:MAG: lysozyme inhibitor LprI family protein [Micavibrio sp.]|nr:lysozyme inhibitor LprI family protein [Micavibrio sp.]